MSDGTMRPQLDEDLVEELTQTVNQETTVPADRLTFGERVEALLEMYRERGDTIDEYDDTVDQYKQRIRELRGEIKENDSGGGGGLLG